MRFLRRKSPPPEIPPEWLVVGLGNPGSEYAGTRHNVGFRVVDRLAAERGETWRRGERQAWTTRIEIAGRAALLIKPSTFMNLSGRAVAPVARRHGIPAERIVVVYDDMDIPSGRLRVRPRGSAGGHRGVRSLIESLQSQEFPRIRIGIGRPADEAIDHVLSRFSREEVPVIEEAIARAGEAVETVITEGPEAAMNRFNPG